MTKNDLNLIHSFIDIKNPKKELDFAYLKDDGIIATDTKKLLFFHASLLGLNIALHKKVLKGFISTMSKDDEATIDGFGFLKSASIKMSCDTWDNKEEFKVFDFQRILDTKFENKFTLEDISDIQFELSQRNCFIDDYNLNPIIQFAECSKFYISYNPQDIENKNFGMVKILGESSKEDESYIKFTAIVMGRTFESKAN